MTKVTTFVFWPSPYFSSLVTDGHFKALCRPVLFGQILNIQTNLRQLKRTISEEIQKKEWHNRRWRYTIITSLSRRMNKCFWEKETVEVGQNLKPSLFGKRKSLKRVEWVFFKRGILYLFHNSIAQLKSSRPYSPPHTKIQDSIKNTMSEF